MDESYITAKKSKHARKKTRLSAPEYCMEDENVKLAVFIKSVLLVSMCMIYKWRKPTQGKRIQR